MRSLKQEVHININESPLYYTLLPLENPLKGVPYDYIRVIK